MYSNFAYLNVWDPHQMIQKQAEAKNDEQRAAEDEKKKVTFFSFITNLVSTFALTYISSFLLFGFNYKV